MTAAVRLQPTVLISGKAASIATSLRRRSSAMVERATARAGAGVPAGTAQPAGPVSAFDLLFERRVGEPDQSTALFVADARDPDLPARELAHFGVRGRDPAASPTGPWVAYAAPDMFGRTDLWVFDRTGGGLSVQLTAGQASDDQPSWSPDGTRLVFRRTTATGTGEIWVIDADGGNPLHITAGQAGTMSAPAWSPAGAPGGERIAYVASVRGTARIWTMRPDGSDRRQITAGGTFDDDPAWSPDGTTLAFSRVGVLTRDIWLVDADGGNERLWLSLPMDQSAPAWSPDGELIAFTSTHEGGSEVYTAAASGPARLIRRTVDGTVKTNPTWVRRA